MKRIKNILSHGFGIDFIAYIITILFILSGMLVSLHRFWQYEVFYYNFGIFDQAIWNVSRFRLPIIEHLLVGGKPLFADHFNVSILLLAPVFWITSRSEALLIIQAIFAGLAGFLIYAIGCHVLKNKLLAVSIACCYFCFIGIQSAVITDFHDLTVMTLPIAVVFYAIVKKHKKLFWIFFLITIGFKEVTSLLGVGIAIFAWLYQRSWRKDAIIAMVLSVLWGILTFFVFIPYFSGGVYLHSPVFPETIQGKIAALFDYPLKRETVLYSFLQFGFLPLFAPSMWIAILQDYVIRFLPKYVETRWSLGLQYNAPVSVLLGIASVFGMSVLLRWKIIQRFQTFIACGLMVHAFILFRFVFHGPFLMAINPDFYRHTQNFSFLDNLVAMIPKDASIMTQNNLGVRFTHQKFFYLRVDYERFAPDYILIDARDGQNPNNFLFIASIDDLVEKIKNDSSYEMFYTNEEQYIFKRKQSVKNFSLLC